MSRGSAVHPVDRLTDVAYAVGWAVVRWMPERVAAALFRRIADSAWRRRGRRMLQLEANLRRVVGDIPQERMDALTRAAMRSYLRYWLEVFRLPNWSQAEIDRRFRSDDIEIVKDAYATGRGLVVALPHMGNWDHAGAWIVRFTGGRLTTVMERLKPESLYDRFIAYREAVGMEVLPLTGGEQKTVGVLARRLREGGLVCLIADRDLSVGGVPVDFFGETATMPAGPAALAVSTGAALIPAMLYYDGPYTRVRIFPEVPVPAEGDRAEKIVAMTQALADVFARSIAEHPEDWHMLQPLWQADLDHRKAPTAPTEPSRPASSQAQSSESESFESELAESELAESETSDSESARSRSSRPSSVRPAEQAAAEAVRGDSIPRERSASPPSPVEQAASPSERAASS